MEGLFISLPRKLVLLVGLLRGIAAYRCFPLRCSSCGPKERQL